MRNNLVVKDNALINASYNLESTEQRLIMLAIISAREKGSEITAHSKLEIHASSYAKMFTVSTDAAYKALKEAVNNLFERQFSYQQTHKNTDKLKVVKSRWVSRIAYVDDLGILEITFAPDVIPLITELEKNFTSYELNQISNLTSKYAIRLYELIIQWRSISKTPILKINDLRSKLGVEDHEYKAMSDFKRRVLNPAIKQISEHTDIIVKYEQHKRGRSISGFSFTFKAKKEAKILTQAKPAKRQNITKDEAQAMAHPGENWNELYTRLSTRYNISNV